MHFFYLDESGCTGEDLTGQHDQPVFVLGGISLRDEGWNKTHEQVVQIFEEYFGGTVPPGFELHATELLSPTGEGPFAGHPITQRLGLVRSLLSLIEDRRHGVHLVAVEKARMAAADCAIALPFNPKVPYLCAFDYLITYINEHTKTRLGSSARAMVILDEKPEFEEEIERIVHARRFEGPAARRIKWIVEFSHPVDSKKNTMVQLSDLVVLCARRFFEIELGHRPGWPDEVKRFYAECYGRIRARIARIGLVPREGRGMAPLNDYLQEIVCQPRRQWQQFYGVAA